MIATLVAPRRRRGSAHLAWRPTSGPGLDGGARGGRFPEPPADFVREAVAEQRRGGRVRRPREPRPYYSPLALRDTAEQVDEGIRAAFWRQRADESGRVLVVPRPVVERLLDLLAEPER